MDFAAFLATVGREAGIPQEDAELAAEATLTTLAERLSPGEAGDIADQLPSELRPLLGTDSPAEGFLLAEFLRRVAEREGVAEATDRTRETAEVHARGVFVALAASVSPDQIEDIVAQLPKELRELFPRPGARG